MKQKFSFSKIPTHYLIVLFALAFTSCQLEIIDVEDPNERAFFGEKLENPYSVENMKKAWENLTIDEKIEIKTTHLYIKFTPKNEEELNILKKDATLDLYDYPLDYKIEKMDDFYREQGISKNQPMPQYCAVPADFTFPGGVDYVVLEELFIPDDYSDERKHNKKYGSDELINRLVAEAMRITNNVEEGRDINEQTTRGSKWRPAGRVRVWDDQIGTTTISTRVFDHWEYYDCGDDGIYKINNNNNLSNRVPVPIEDPKCKRAIYRTEYSTIPGSYVPVVNLEVKARRWYTTHRGTTGSDGRYSASGRFNNDANYSIMWEKHQFSIRSGTFGQAWLDGPKKRGDWNVDLGVQGSSDVNDKQQYYALIFQAARDYYYGNRFGLSSPPRNTSSTPQIKIAAYLENSTSHAAVYLNSLGLSTILPGVQMRVYGGSSARVYAVTAHELAHFAHWDMDRNAFVVLAAAAYAASQDASEAVIESWATGVEWQFAMGRYRDQYNNPGYEYPGNEQWKRISPWGTGSHLIYTSLVIDLIDNCNQHTDRCSASAVFPISQYPIDNVSGYTIQQVEQGLRGARSWNRWRDNMRNIHTNPTEGNLNQLFGNWY